MFGIKRIEMPKSWVNFKFINDVNQYCKAMCNEFKLCQDVNCEY